MDSSPYVTGWFHRILLDEYAIFIGLEDLIGQFMIPIFLVIDLSDHTGLFVFTVKAPVR
jgi:hypothetical protein